jgi:hypothetical protein
MARVSVILACLFSTLCVPNVGAEEVNTHTSFSCDLDGDGVAEAVEFRMSAIHTSSTTYYDDYYLSINGVGTSRFGNGLTGFCRPVDVDSTDKCVELAVSVTGPSGDDATHFFRYSNGELVEIGTLPGRPQSEWRPLVIDGSGVVVAHCRGRILHTWFYSCKHGINANGVFERIPEPTYPMGAVLTLKQGFALVEEIGSTAAAVELNQGDQITLLCSDDERWCLAETEDHRQGWFEVSSFNLLSDGRRATEVFKGLCMAD